MPSLPPLPEAATPITEAELAKLTVGGPPTQLTDKIQIHEYDPSWPALYEWQSQRIRAALGPVALVIEHVGSTAVSGLPAKFLIDIDVIVADLADESTYVPALKEAGYILRVREPDWYEHRCFKSYDPEVNLHVFSPGCDEHARHLILRDWLRTHPADRDLYAARKREIAQGDLTYMAQYSDAKTDVIIDILRRAGLT